MRKDVEKQPKNNQKKQTKRKTSVLTYDIYSIA